MTKEFGRGRLDKKDQGQIKRECIVTGSIPAKKKGGKIRWDNRKRRND
ncbi:MAG: hypothetical protein Q7J67_04440 [bacterium]|nr:hypothetical protein [bacterium]